jgi:nucleotide sugar dehydrogenase
MKIAVIGLGKLGICTAVKLAEKYEVLGYDASLAVRTSIKHKTFVTEEPGVQDALSIVSIEVIDCIEDAVRADQAWVIVPTPSTTDGSFDVSAVDDAVMKLKSCGFSGQIVVNSTVNPGDCSRWGAAYNPEFIAQGTIMRDFVNPDMVLIGIDAGDPAGIVDVYNNICENKPKFHIMSTCEAEITKIGLNCFLTTKIAYSNMIGDIARAYGGAPQVVLDAIASDGRVGRSLTRYGWPYGGPCLPRDNRALFAAASKVGAEKFAGIPLAVDGTNRAHIDFLVEHGPTEPFDYLSYKKESNMTTESGPLAVFNGLRAAGKDPIHTESRQSVLSQIKE